MKICRFNLADDIIDTVVCREIWKISDDQNISSEAEKRSMFASNLCKIYLEFSGELIFGYVKTNWVG